MRKPILLIRCVAVLALGSLSAGAGSIFYLGTWKIVTATVAPWAEPGNRDGHVPYEPAKAVLMGKTILFRPTAIVGPGLVACKGPKYVIKDYPAEMLFQGGFGEMQRKNRSVDPVKIAAKLGFRGASWKTLETGCAIEIDWHYIDDKTTTFALDNYIYTVKKQP